MGNSFFQFKQFRVEQDRCAMKVSTEACLLGAYTANWISYNLMEYPEIKIHKGMDIGAGTGLLSLMLVQNLPDIQMDAIEVELIASVQCRENFHNSPWNSRLKIHPLAFQDFREAENDYDLIISNPPFHENQLNGSRDKENLAYHSTQLRLKELFAGVYRYIRKTGIFFLLIPVYRIDECLNLAREVELDLIHKVFIRSSPNHLDLRCILLFSKINIREADQEIICIRDGNHEYSERFMSLLKNYYLEK